jgi:hypothetical protein
MTHASIPAEIRVKRGIDDALVRLSVGIEDVTDLQRDLDRALASPITGKVQGAYSSLPGLPAGFVAGQREYTSN